MPLHRSVRPPRDHSMMWWASHHEGGRSQPGKRHPPSRAASAMRCRGENSRCDRPRSTTCPVESMMIGVTPASHTARSTVSMLTGCCEPSMRPAPLRDRRSASRTSSCTAGRAEPMARASTDPPRRTSSTNASAATCSTVRSSAGSFDADESTKRGPPRRGEVAASYADSMIAPSSGPKSP